MNKAIGRRLVILAACLFGIAGLSTAQAQPVSFTVALSGANLVPPVRTTGKGAAQIAYDPASRAVSWSISYSGLSSPATMAHFHGPAAPGTNGPVEIWLTVKGSPPENPITGHTTLTAAQARQFLAGHWYINLHTKSHPAGEIRGQVVPPKE